MNKEKPPLQVKHLIGGLVGGVLAGAVAGSLWLLCAERENPGVFLTAVIAGSGVWGILYGGYYREAQRSLKIALLVLVQLLCFWLGGIVVFMIAKALEFKSLLSIVAPSFGALLGDWLGRVVISKILLQKPANKEAS